MATMSPARRTETKRELRRQVRELGERIARMHREVRELSELRHAIRERITKAPDACSAVWSNDYGRWCCTLKDGHRGAHMEEL